MELLPTLLSPTLVLLSLGLPELSASAGALLQPTAKAIASNSGKILMTDFFICWNPPLNTESEDSSVTAGAVGRKLL
ncbi:MAG TPA: hypothetical protein VL177_13575 [Terriglobales bacterium]|nr:hypothetical protein [Terriglobales bacterium]